MAWRLAAAAALAIGLAGLAGAQEVPGFRTPILTIDAERLYAQSLFGQRVEGEIIAAEQELATENRRIEEALTAEERGLTERRATMEPEAFRELAEEFDARVQDIRAAQDAKERALGRLRGDGQRAFLQAATPILGEIMRERGATVILERRSVFGSLDAIDVTDLAVARADARIGSGEDLALPRDGPEEDEPPTSDPPAPGTQDP